VKTSISMGRWSGLKLIEAIGIDKRYPGVHALKSVDFEVESGEVHVLVGENGAGKSTLIKILKGDEPGDGGEILYKGKKVDANVFFASKESPISVVYQEFTLEPDISVAENIFLGSIPSRLGVVDWKRCYRDSKRILAELGHTEIDVRENVGNLSVAQQQIVEIAKAYSKNPEIFILDEPTTTFSEEEVKKLFLTIQKLTGQGKAIIYVSHRLEEVFEIGDRVTVLRDGAKIGTESIDDLDHKKLVTMMIGKEVLVEQRASYTEEFGNKKVLEINGLSTQGLQDCSMYLKEGEIVGLIGLMGAGHKLVQNVLFGITDKKNYTGEIVLKGQSYHPSSISDAMKHGVCLIPEDRKNEGILGEMDIMSNICISNPQNNTHLNFVIDTKKSQKIAQKYIDRISIATPGTKQLVNNLSGGNQQKVIISRLLNTEARIFIFCEPTRGVDIGAKNEIYKIMDEIAKAGKSILMISSELPEVASVCDRVYAFHAGKIVAEMGHEEFTQNEALYAIAGGK